MLIDVQNTHAYVRAASDGERRWLSAFLAFDDTSFRARGRKVEMYDRLAKRFPRGFLHFVERGAAEEDIKLDIVDRRQRTLPDLSADLGWLRDYQRGAVDAAVAAGQGIIWAPTGCITGDAEVGVNRAGKSFKLPLRDLVARFNGARITWGKGARVNPEKGAGMHWDPATPTMLRARAEDGTVRLHRLAAAVSTGIKPVFQITTESGHKIRATADHLFLTPFGWRRLSELTLESRVFVEAPPVKGPSKQKPWYKLIGGLRHHPFAGRRGVRAGKGGWSVPLHRLVAEAHLSGYTLDTFLACIRAGEVDGLQFLDPRVSSVHHTDENPTNNDHGNLVILPVRDHAALHGRAKNWRHVAASTALSRVTAIAAAGAEETFDLTMKGEPRNFLANGIVVHNSGKTEIAAGLVRLMPVRWLFLVHREQLVRDAADRYTLRTGDTAGCIGGGEWAEGERLTCTTFQTFHTAISNAGHPLHQKARALAASVGGFIADEGHTLAADTFWACVMALPNAFYRIAMSGTPLDRTDRRGLLVMAATGRVVYRIKTERLIADGTLSKPRIRMIDCDQPEPTLRPGAAANHQEVYRALIVRSEKRNRMLVDAALAAAKPALLFVKEITHGKAMEKALSRAGLRVMFVWGSDSVERRREKITRLTRGDLDLLICNVVFQEGIDIPSLRSVIIGSGGKSTIATLQRIGRGMRAFAGKDEFEVYDLMDRGQRWMASHALGRFKAYSKEGHEVVVISPGALSVMGGAAKNIDAQG